MARQVMLWIAVGAALAALSSSTGGLLAKASGILAVLALILAGLILLAAGLGRRRPAARSAEADPQREGEE